jgi:hypothetical protein
MKRFSYETRKIAKLNLINNQAEASLMKHEQTLSLTKIAWYLSRLNNNRAKSDYVLPQAKSSWTGCSSPEDDHGYFSDFIYLTVFTLYIYFVYLWHVFCFQ